MNQSTSNSSNLDTIARDVQAHASSLTEDQSLIKKLFGVVVDTIVPQVNLLISVSERMKQANLDIYTLLSKMQSSVALCMSPSVWAQEPVMFEDACRRRFPIPSEYSFQMATAVIEANFSSGPGSLTIKSGQYELHNISHNRYITSQDWISGFQPGAVVKMGVLRPLLNEGDCANPRCDSRTYETDRFGYMTW